MTQLRRSEQSGGGTTSSAQVAGITLTSDFLQETDPLRVRLIVNADDLGMSEPITDVILATHEGGIVTSASMLANMPDTVRAAKLLLERGSLPVGLHFNLSQGRPVSEPRDIPSLVADTGDFHPKTVQFERLANDRGAADDVRRELTAQVERLRALGLDPVHVDGHQGAQLVPMVERILLEMAGRLGLRATRTRLGLPLLGPQAGAYDQFRRIAASLRALPAITRDWRQRSRSRRAGLQTGDGQLRRMRIYPPAPDAQTKLLDQLWGLPKGNWELILHPGPTAGDTLNSPKYAHRHGEDARLATDPRVKSLITNRGISLISYRELGQ